MNAATVEPPDIFNPFDPPKPALPEGCDFVDPKEKASGCMIYDQITKTWKPIGSMDTTIEMLIKGSAGRYTYAARCRYTRENPPPPPDGHVLLPADAMAMCFDMAYAPGKGWYEFGLEGAWVEFDNQVVAVARISQFEIRGAPNNSEIVVLKPDDIMFRHRYYIAHPNGWLAPVEGATAKSYEGRTIARLNYKSSMPITEKNGNDPILPGDFVWDVDYCVWDRWVGPTGASLFSIRPGYWWMGAVASLNKEFLSDEHNLLGFHTEITETTEVLMPNKKDVYEWRKPTKSMLGKPAWYLTDIVGIRLKKGDPVNIPVAKFMPIKLLDMLRNEPSSDLVRGLVRRELRIVIPREMMAAGKADDIERFLECEYTKMNPVAGFAQPIRACEARARAVKNWKSNQMVTVEVSLYEANTMDGIQRTDTLVGPIEVPRDVHAMGHSEMHQWINRQYQSGELRIGDLARARGRDHRDTAYRAAAPTLIDVEFRE